MTRSAEMIAKVRDLAHQERNAVSRGALAILAGRLSVAALELAQEHETLVAQALTAEETIHRMVKEKEDGGKA